MGPQGYDGTNQPPYPGQPYYGRHPEKYPQYGPLQPQSPPPPRKSKLGWILGCIAVSLTLCGFLLFTGCTALVSEINGGGGSHAEKAAAMVAAADNVPEDDWVLVHRFDPQVEPGCLSIDTHCLRLSAVWEVPHRVGLTDVANRLGMDVSGPPTGSFSGCLRELPRDGNSMTSLCIDENSGGEDFYRVSIQMTRK